MHKTLNELQAIAKQIRLFALEQTVLKGKGHLGGTYSCIDILVSLFYSVLSLRPSDPKWPYRDRFLLSKGHACLAMYPILVDLGFLTQERAMTYGLDGGLGGQLDTSIAGIEWNTGSLGHTLGIASGMALSSRLDNASFHVFTVVGDGEFAEGSVWESIMSIGSLGLCNITCIVDRNRLSVTEFLDDDSFFKNLRDVMEAFGWEYNEVNGHNFEEMSCVFGRCKISSKPTLVIANTIKGKGVSFMENTLKWHHSVPTMRELEAARSELDA